ncbi:hypothetical protein DAEQUDRAFT_493104 [Daedalea quercina L-15889]|uniref:Uncharacterized protein n=1 Tax=Daedalea quercina L-15889 TaxID=1314783 RepID=A0A165MMB6_9APHY|nr:hypothetical protein DAEQUDRAFT_493104 [Daedalea quercina L-15889]
MAQLTNHVQNKRNEIEEHKRMGRVKEAADGERDYGKLLQFFKQAQVLFQKNTQSVPPSQSQPAPLNNSGVPRVESSINVGSTGAASMLGIPSTPAVTGVASTTNSDLQTSVPHLLSTDHTGEMAHLPPTLPEPLPALHTASTTQTPLHPLRPISANSLPPANASSNGLPQTSPAATNVRGTRPPTASQGGSYSRVWDGPVTWVEPTSGRPLQAHMAVNAPDVLRTFPWPPTLTLEPSTEFRVNMPKLQDWLRGHANQYSILLVTSHSPTGDPKQNEERHGLLWRSIFQSHRYAVVSFLDHSGMVSVKRLLLFPARPGQFAGALFRGPGGIPELPPLFVGGIPVTQVPPNLADLLLSLTPQQSAELEKLSNPDKHAKLQEYARNYRQMKMQEQQRLLMMQQAQQSRQQVMQPLQPLDTMPGTPAMAPSTMTSQPPPQQQSPPSTQRRKPVPPNNLNTLIPVNPFLNGIPPSVDQVLALGGSTPQASTQIPGRMSSAAPTSTGMQGMHRRVPSGGGSTNVPAMGGVNLSHEMMQSFMQRRQDGSSGMGGATDGGIGGGMGL